MPFVATLGCRFPAISSEHPRPNARHYILSESSRHLSAALQDAFQTLGVALGAGHLETSLHGLQRA
ncbi:hypothetical protein THIOKS1500012 [Thiocapsa sp. KS1]|nr:hypothetical protein THIOKS1500012 [Thiocapsa sp. KS1]